MCHLIIKLVLTIFFNYADQVHPWVLITFLIASSLAWMFLFLYYLPFYSPRAKFVAAARYLPASACSHVPACTLPPPPALTASLPPCLLTPSPQPRSQVEVAFTAVFAWATVCVVLSEVDNSSKDAAGVVFWMALPFVALAGAYAVSVRIKTLRSTMMRSPYLVELRTRYLLQYKKDLERLDLDTSAIDAGVETTYQEALRDHPYAALVHVFYAQYLRHYKGSQSLEVVQLNVGARKDPALDLRFLIYQRKKEVEEEELTSAPHRMTVVMRVAAERHEVESHQAMVKAKNQQILFWSQLLDPEPDLAQCARTSSPRRDHQPFSAPHPLPPRRPVLVQAAHDRTGHQRRLRERRAPLQPAAAHQPAERERAPQLLALPPRSGQQQGKGTSPVPATP